MRMEDENRRDFYLNECTEYNWSIGQLERQMHSLFYERLLAIQPKQRDSIKSKIEKTKPKKDLEYILKDPYILEFLNLKQNKAYYKKDLEQGLLEY